MRIRTLGRTVALAAALALAAPLTPGLSAPAQAAERPGPGNTGVPAGTALTVHQGDLTVTQAGTVIDSMDIRGFVTIQAPNVVIKNSIIRGQATTKQRALVSSTLDTASVTIVDSELSPTSPSSYIDGIRGWNITARRVNIHRVIDSAHLWGRGNVVIEDSWLHDNLHLENDPQWGGKPSHDDSIQIQEGSNIRIRNNTITGAFNTGIQFTQDRGPVWDVDVSGNFLDGGGCTVNFAEKDLGPFQSVTVAGNTFGRTTKVENCAIIAPSATRSALVATNNVYTDGAGVTVRNGGVSSVTTPAPLPNQAPKGAIDAASATASTLTVSGWAFDPDSAGSTSVHVYVDGTFTQAVKATATRADVGRAYQRASEVGYTTTVPVTAGNHRVCVYAIDTAGGPNPSLGCKDVAAG